MNPESHDGILNALRVTRSQFVLRLCRLCFFPLASVLIGTSTLLFVPQAREVIGLIGENPWFPNFHWFAAAYVYLAFSTWFTARALIGRRYPRDPIGLCDSAPFAAAAVRMLPRLLAVAATLPVALFFLASVRTEYGVCLLLLTGAFLGLVAYRTRIRSPVIGGAIGVLATSFGVGWFTADGQGSSAAGWAVLALVAAAVLALALVTRRETSSDAARDELFGFALDPARPGQPVPLPGEQFAHFDGLTRRGSGVAAWLFVPSFGMLALLWAGEECVARHVGAAAILLTALASWTLFGGLLLTYLPKARLGMPAFTWIPALCVVAFARCNDNHGVAVRGVARSQRAATASDRPLLQTHFAAWIKRTGSPSSGTPDQDPVFVVAVTGGASRAAHWGGVTLARLEYETRIGRASTDSVTRSAELPSPRGFGERIYVISGVSGGSVGAAAYVSALADNPGRAGGPCILEQTAAFTGQDHASPLLALMLFPDLIQRFLPWPVLASADRSLGLERTWEQDWVQSRKASTSCESVRPSRPNEWEQEIADLYDAGLATGVPAPGDCGAGQRCDLPSLILNTATIEHGARVLQSNLRIPSASALDLLAPPLVTAGLRLSGAVHNSARFPYASPAGTVRMRATSSEAAATSATDTRGPVWGHVVDGGYFEASGAESLVDVLTLLERDDKLHRVGRRLETTTGRPVVAIVVDNTPSAEADWLCRPDRPAEPDAAVRRPAGTAPNLLEVFGPPLGLFEARGGRGRDAEVRLRDRVGGCGPQFIELRLPRYLVQTQPAMTWGLNGTSRQLMAAATLARTSPCTVADRYLLDNLRALRHWLGVSSDPVVPPWQCHVGAVSGGQS
ncbi:MAG: hypothetical protein U1F52_07445 [Burkholderiales bacterium]